MAPEAFFYKIEIRDKSGTLLEIANQDVFQIFWSYDSLGGCGEAEIALRREFDNFKDIDLDYDIQIWGEKDQAPSGGTRFGASGLQLTATGPVLAGVHAIDQLRWRGFVREIVPAFDIRERVTLRCSGYSRYLEYIAVPVTTYASQDVSTAVKSILDDFVIPKTKIKRTAELNLVQDTGVTISSTGLKFDTSSMEAIRNLGEIGGNAEWGVRPDLEFYFLPRSAAIKQTHYLGNRVKFYDFSTSTDEVVRKVFLRGLSGFTATLTSSGPGPESGFEKERVVTVASIADANDATIWGNAYFDRFKEAQNKGSLVLASSVDFIENVEGQTMPPLGKLRLLGGPLIIGKGPTLPAQFGPSGIALAPTLGAAHDQSYRIVSVTYRPKGTALQIEIDLGEKRSGLSDLLRFIEFKLSEIRQVAA